MKPPTRHTLASHAALCCILPLLLACPSALRIADAQQPAGAAVRQQPHAPVAPEDESDASAKPDDARRTDHHLAAPTAKEVRMLHEAFLREQKRIKREKKRKAIEKAKREHYENTHRVVPKYPYHNDGVRRKAAESMDKAIANHSLYRNPRVSKHPVQAQLSPMDPALRYKAEEKKADPLKRHPMGTYVAGCCIILLCLSIFLQYRKYRLYESLSHQEIHGALENIRVHRHHARTELLQAVQRKKDRGRDTKQFFLLDKHLDSVSGSASADSNKLAGKRSSGKFRKLTASHAAVPADKQAEPTQPSHAGKYDTKGLRKLNTETPKSASSPQPGAPPSKTKKLRNLSGARPAISRKPPS